LVSPGRWEGARTQARLNVRQAFGGADDAEQKDRKGDDAKHRGKQEGSAGLVALAP
jgi:hypothetical protein